jgi:hypothetical protein
MLRRTGHGTRRMVFPWSVIDYGPQLFRPLEILAQDTLFSCPLALKNVGMLENSDKRLSAASSSTSAAVWIVTTNTSLNSSFNTFIVS